MKTTKYDTFSYCKFCSKKQSSVLLAVMNELNSIFDEEKIKNSFAFLTLFNVCFQCYEQWTSPYLNSNLSLCPCLYMPLFLPRSQNGKNSILFFLWRIHSCDQYLDPKQIRCVYHYIRTDTTLSPSIQQLFTVCFLMTKGKKIDGARVLKVDSTQASFHSLYPLSQYSTYISIVYCYR